MFQDNKSRYSRCDLLYITKSYDTFVSLCTRYNNHIILTFFTVQINQNHMRHEMFYFENVACDLKYVACNTKTPVYTVRLDYECACLVWTSAHVWYGDAVNFLGERDFVVLDSFLV